MKLLDGNMVVVTGASSGIEKSAAMLFAAKSTSVVLVARRQAQLDQSVEEIESRGGRALAIIGDVAEERTHKDAIAVARAAFGGLDVACNNAG